uniref:Uncharacterized protein n=1 Tax=Anguilla anguilla TaxID=7936 RepID=A0A0E9SUJ3_ANGAN
MLTTASFSLYMFTVGPFPFSEGKRLWVCPCPCAANVSPLLLCAIISETRYYVSTLSHNGIS